MASEKRGVHFLIAKTLKVCQAHKTFEFWPNILCATKYRLDLILEKFFVFLLAEGRENE